MSNEQISRLQIQIDTREHEKERVRIEKQFDSLGVQHFRSKLFVGDYCAVDNPRVVIDRKKDLQELCGNVTHQHERFKAELIRAQENGFAIIILVEHGVDVRTLEDVYFWQNPRKHHVYWKTINGKKTRCVASEKAVDGAQLYKAMCTIRDRYGVRFEFCEKKDTGRKIIELLTDETA